MRCKNDDDILKNLLLDALQFGYLEVKRLVDFSFV